MCLPGEGDWIALRLSIKHCSTFAGGGTSYIVADHPTYSETRATLFGRAVSFSPSIPMLSKVSSAKVVPIVARWGRGGRILVKHGNPLAASDSDGLYRQLARWFETYLIEHPQELEPKYLMKLMFSPPVDEVS